MNSNKMRIAIGELHGYRRVPCPDSSLVGGDPQDPQPMTYWAESFWDGDTIGLPDYLNDLNAMSAAERTLSGDEFRIFLGFLMGDRTIPKLASVDEFHEAWNSKSRKRAIAFLKTHEVLK